MPSSCFPKTVKMNQVEGGEWTATDPEVSLLCSKSESFRFVSHNNKSGTDSKYPLSFEV